MWKNLQLSALQALRSFEYSTRIPVTSMLTDTGLSCVHDVFWYQSTWSGTGHRRNICSMPLMQDYAELSG